MKYCIFLLHLLLEIFQVALEKLNSEVRLNAAIEYLMQFPDPNLNVEKFEESSGVGVVVTEAMIKEEVGKVISAAKVGYHFGVAIAFIWIG